MSLITKIFDTIIVCITVMYNIFTIVLTGTFGIVGVFLRPYEIENAIPGVLVLIGGCIVINIINYTIRVLIRTVKFKKK